MQNKNLFVECNPNPAIEISRKTKSVLYLNLAARVQFPQLEVEGLNSSILHGIEDSFSAISASNDRLILMVREVTSHNFVFEQQIFSAAEEDSLFIYMINITHYKEVEKQAGFSGEMFKKAEEIYKSQLKAAQDEHNNSLEIFNRRREQDRLALRAANVGTWNWHVPCDLITWDESMSELLGLKSNINSGNFKVILNVIHPNDRNRVSSEIRDSWLNHTPYDTQFRVMKPDGHVCEIRMKGESYSDDCGQPVGLTGVCLAATPVEKNVKVCMS